jgi:hypothetical protein
MFKNQDSISDNSESENRRYETDPYWVLNYASHKANVYSIPLK